MLFVEALRSTFQQQEVCCRAGRLPTLGNSRHEARSSSEGGVEATGRKVRRYHILQRELPGRTRVAGPASAAAAETAHESGKHAAQLGDTVWMRLNL